MSEAAEQSFQSEVESAAKDAGVVDAPMTEEEQAIPTEAEGLPDEPAPPKAEEPPPLRQSVPLAVHIRQREKHDREIREMREQFNIGNQRLAQLVQSLQPAPPPPPDRDSDPLGAALSKLDALEQNVSQVVQVTAQERQQQQVRQQIQQFERAVYEDEQAYKSEVPDLNEAMTYAKDTKFREYVALGMDAQQASARVQQDAFALASHAFQNGLSPSDLVYRMAHALGYKKGITSPQRIDPAVAKNSTAANGQMPAAEVIEMRAAGSERSRAGGGAPENLGPMTLQQLATMDNDEFAKMTAGKKWDKLFKG